MDITSKLDVTYNYFRDRIPIPTSRLYLEQIFALIPKYHLPCFFAFFFFKGNRLTVWGKKYLKTA